MDPTSSRRGFAHMNFKLGASTARLVPLATNRGHQPHDRRGAQPWDPRGQWPLPGSATTATVVADFGSDRLQVEGAPFLNDPGQGHVDVGFTATESVLAPPIF